MVPSLVGRTPRHGAKWLGERIAELRLKRGITQVELAQRLGISKAQMSRHEHGRSILAFEDMCRISNVLGVTLEHFRPTPQVPGDPLLTALRANHLREPA